MSVYKNKHFSSFYFFSTSPLVLCLAYGSLFESRGVNRRSVHIYWKHKHAKSEDKPLQIQL